MKFNFGVLLRHGKRWVGGVTFGHTTDSSPTQHKPNRRILLLNVSSLKYILGMETPKWIITPTCTYYEMNLNQDYI